MAAIFTPPRVSPRGNTRRARWLPALSEAASLPGPGALVLPRRPGEPTRWTLLRRALRTAVAGLLAATGLLLVVLILLPALFLGLLLALVGLAPLLALGLGIALTGAVERPAAAGPHQ